MALSFNLADLFVQFSVKGVEALNHAFEGIQAHLQKVQAGAQAMSSAIESTFGRARVVLLGFVTAGVATSAMGEMLTARMGMLTREIASLFIPQLQALTNGIQKLTDWFRSLSGEQQRSIGNWLLAGAAVLTVVKVVPLLISGIVATIAAIRSLTVAIIALESSTGIGALLPIIGATITALAALFVGTTIGQRGLSGLWAAIKPVVDAIRALWAASEPARAALANLFNALSPLLKLGGDLGAVLMKILVPAFQILASVVAALFRILTPIVSFFVQLAQVIITVLLTPLRIVAALFEAIAKSVAFLTGQKFDLGDKTKGAGKEGEGHQTLAPRSSGFEGLASAWERVARSSIIIGGEKRVEEKQLDELVQIREAVQGSKERLGKEKPLIVP